MPLRLRLLPLLQELLQLQQRRLVLLLQLPLPSRLLHQLLEFPLPDPLLLYSLSLTPTLTQVALLQSLSGLRGKRTHQLLKLYRVHRRLHRNHTHVVRLFLSVVEVFLVVEIAEEFVADDAQLI